MPEPKQPQDHKKSFADIIASAKPVVRSVTLCLAGDLNAQYEDLARELDAAIKSPRTTLADVGAERAIAEKMEAVREQMTEHEVIFRFRGLSSKAWSDLMSQHPGRTGKEEAFNVDTFPDAMLAACAVEPVMELEQVHELGDALSNAQFSELFDCAWACNQKSLDVPFSALASRLLRESGTS